MMASLQTLGLGPPADWVSTVLTALAWLGLMLAYSPLADRIATRLVATPPQLSVFRGLQESRSRLIMGIILAWVFGGFLEELLLRGILLPWMEARLSAWIPAAMVAIIAVFAVAVVAGFLHLYQGLRAAIIVAQLSVLFGFLAIITRHNLWPVILCHGMYDTIAFIRFANKKSKYSKT